MFTHKKSYNHFCHYGCYFKNGKYLRNVHLIYHNLVWFMWLYFFLNGIVDVICPNKKTTRTFEHRWEAWRVLVVQSYKVFITLTSFPDEKLYFKLLLLQNQIILLWVVSMADKKRCVVLKMHSFGNQILLNDLHVISRENGRNL